VATIVELKRDTKFTLSCKVDLGATRTHYNYNSRETKVIEQRHVHNLGVLVNTLNL